MTQDSSAFFSIIITSYNNGSYLLEAVKSIASQSFDDYEIIMVDDCSEDGSLSELKLQLDKKTHWSDKITLFSFSENQGVSAVRNKGVSEASGEYLLFLDGDDFHIGESLQILHDEIHKKNRPEVLIFPYSIYSFDGEFHSTYSRMNGLFGDYVGKDMVPFVPTMDINPSPWNKVISMRYWRENSFLFNNKLRRCQDLELMPFIWCKANTVVVIDKFLYGYRVEVGKSKKLFDANNIKYIELAVTGLINYLSNAKLIGDNSVSESLMGLVINQFNIVFKRVKKDPTHENLLLFDESFFRVLKVFDISVFSVWQSPKGRSILWDLILLKSHFSINKSIPQKYLFCLIRLHYLKLKVSRFL